MTGAPRFVRARGIHVALGWCAVLAAASCAGSPARPPRSARAPLDGLAEAPGRPPVAGLVREGDPSAGVSVAILTAGVDEARGAEVPVALAGVVEARLAAAGVRDAEVVASNEGFRVRVLLSAASRAPDLALRLHEALVTPLTAEGPELEGATKKLAALARLPAPDAAVRGVARCAGVPFSPRGPGEPAPRTGVAELDAWRVASLGLGRVVVGVVGTRDAVDALTSAVARGPAWPSATPLAGVVRAPSADPAALAVYDASPDVPAGGARVTLLAEVRDAERAVRAATQLAEARGALADSLGEISSRMGPGSRDGAIGRDVTATAHPGWGCLSVSFDLPPPAGSADPPLDLAFAIDLAKREAVAALDEAPAPSDGPRALANRAGDPRDAAERLAYWALLAGASASSPSTAPDARPTTLAAIVGLGAPRSGSAEPTLAARAGAIVAELARAEKAREDPFADVRLRVEQGQSGVWLLLASPCGTEAETAADAGSSAMAAMAVAERVRREGRAGDAVEPWVTPDGVGLLVHAFPERGESSVALARRAAGVAVRAFSARTLDPHDVAAARAALLAPRAHEDQRAFSVLADALAQGHPSWVSPLGTPDAIERGSDEGVKARLGALRGGPLRIAVLAGAAVSPGDVAPGALARWLPSAATTRRACPGAPARTVRPGTYAVEVPGASSATAWLAIALPAGDAESLAAAAVLAAALARPAGLLERALGGGLARSWSARVVGSPRAPALVVRVASAQGSLDAAVAETRVLLDRLRVRGLDDAEVDLAVERTLRDRLHAALDPRTRLAALWRGEPDGASAPPSPEALRAFVARTLRDDDLVIVAARPPRVTLR